MYAVFGRRLRHNALALLGFQRHTGFEPRVMVPAFLHVLISSFLEISNGRFHTECLNQHWFMTLADAAEKLEAWRNY